MFNVVANCLTIYFVVFKLYDYICNEMDRGTKRICKKERANHCFKRISNVTRFVPWRAERWTLANIRSIFDIIFEKTLDNCQ